MSTFSKNIISTSVTLIINTFIGFIASIYLARILGAAGRGEMAIFNASLSLFVSFMELGIGSCIIYFLSSGKIDSSRLFVSNLYFIMISSVVMIIIIFFLSELNFNHLIFPTKYSGYTYRIIFIILFIVTKINSVLNLFLLARKKFIIANLVSFIINTVTLVTYIVIFYFYKELHHDSKIIIWITFIISFINLSCWLYYFNGEYKVDFNFRQLINKQQLREIFNYGGLNYLANFLQFFAYRMDFWIVDHYSGKHILGIYALAVSLVQLIWLIPNSISSVLFSYASSFDKGEESRSRTIILCKISFYLSFILGFIGVTVSYWIIPILYGEEFVPVTNLMAVLLIGIVPFCFPIVIASYNAGHNKVMVNLKGVIIGLVICIALDFLLIPQYGAEGAAIATVVSYLANSCYLVYIFIKEDGDWKSFFLFKKEELIKIPGYSKLVNR